ncbi:hypothetical protein BROUX41_004667 [Berkeleyomyces rouxiae]|uniref:uncharacterized protein n=1 Tax=Berkeleyomyces rouxiae TaxID=2035830 RepID=UPI003B7B366F
MALLESQGSEDLMAVDASRKRSHDEYSSDDDLSSVPSEDLAMFDAPEKGEPAKTSLPSLKPTPNAPNPPLGNQLKQADNSITHQNKRKRLTASEKATKLEEEAVKKKEREEAKQAKAAEKAKADAEKAAARAKVDAERAAKQAERDEKKRKKEEEDRRIQEEKDKKERSQMRLNSFFKRPIPTKPLDKSVSGTPTTKTDTATPTNKVENDYRKTFKPFFIKESVRMAPLAAQKMDPETCAAKSKILDDYMLHKRGEEIPVLPFRPRESFQFPSKPVRRGVVYPPVKRLVEDIRERAFGDKGIEVSRAQLNQIPVKTLFFSTDVRPAYCGTLTGPQYDYGRDLMARVARRPRSRVLPSVAYDYDSEAEWVDDELGEDVDLDDDDEEIDDEDDMDGFLDDSEDAGIARGAFSNSMEPESTGICFETEKQYNAVPGLYTYRMEFVLDSIAPTGSIDPFSTEYWEPAVKRTRPPTTGPSTNSKMLPPPPSAPANAFEALVTNGKANYTASSTATNNAMATAPDGSATNAPQILELRRPELLPEIRKVIVDNAKLSKVGLIDVLFHQVEGITKGEAKMALDVLAVKVGAGRAKQWALKENE